MKYLVIGSGGREHAMAWALKKDEPQAELFIAPGNGGTEQQGTNVPIEATDLDGLVAWARKQRPDLTIVGPEAPLCAGIVDRFQAAGLAIFGPNQAAARLEGSKVYAKRFLLKHGLPTASGECFHNSAAARAYSRAHPEFPQVIKADGLASGKGVILAQDAEEAESAIRRIMDERVFGDAGKEIVIEEFLPGREMSVHVLCDGISYHMLPIAQDHKRLLDGDLGPNTGGMGAYAPAPFATPELRQLIAREIVEPTLHAFIKEQIDFRGILFIGLMWTEEGLKILEFNARGGDPETQVLLPLLAAPPFGDILKAVCSQTLGSLQIAYHQRAAVAVVLATAGYPENPDVGTPIQGLNNQYKDAFVFHGGTKRIGTNYLTSGGRVASVVSWGDGIDAVRAHVYENSKRISFAGAWFRADIALNQTLRR